MQIVFASAECAPFVEAGGLGDVAGSLPAALVRAGAEVIVMVPKYATIKDEYKAQMEHFSDFYVSLGWRNEYCGLESSSTTASPICSSTTSATLRATIQYGLFDDGRRFTRSSPRPSPRACNTCLPALSATSCTATTGRRHLRPCFAQRVLPGPAAVRPRQDRVLDAPWRSRASLATTVMEDILGVAHIPAAASQLRCDACSINYMLGALRYADAITTVSPTYANEIRRPNLARAWTAFCVNVRTRCRAF